MRGIGGRIVSVVAVMAAGLTWAAAPAQAHVDACAISGSMELFGRMGQYGVHHDKVMYYEIRLTDGGCLASDTIVITGRVWGTCMSATVNGTTDDGHFFTGEWKGTQWYLTGKVTGTLTVFETPLYPLCISGAAWAFMVEGALTETHLT